jgi:hypothetical protein
MLEVARKVLLNLFRSIPLKWKLAAILAAAFFVGIMGWKSAIISAAENRVRADIEKKRLDAIRKAKEHRNEVEGLDRETLAGRARIWVRGNRD